MFATLEGVFSVPIKALIGPEYYLREWVLLSLLVLIIIVGFVVNSWIIQKYLLVASLFSQKFPL
jgi:hypothetical protein